MAISPDFTNFPLDSDDYIHHFIAKPRKSLAPNIDQMPSSKHDARLVRIPARILPISFKYLDSIFKLIKSNKFPTRPQMHDLGD